MDPSVLDLFLQGEVMRLRSIGAVLLGLVLLSFGPASAQERFGALTGVVMDPSSAPVPGASVTAKNKESGKVRTQSAGRWFGRLFQKPARRIENRRRWKNVERTRHSARFSRRRVENSIGERP